MNVFSVLEVCQRVNDDNDKKSQTLAYSTIKAGIDINVPSRNPLIAIDPENVHGQR